MVPTDVVVRAALPRSPNGKFDRTCLRQELTSDVSAVGAPSSRRSMQPVDGAAAPSAASPLESRSPSGSAARRSSPTTAGC